MATWAFYSDSGLTNTVTGLNATNNPTTNFHVWFGSTTTGRKLIAQSTGATIYAIPADSATGGHAVSAIKMSLTSGGLSSASGGASLALATSSSIVGGVANAVDWWVSVTDAVGNGVVSTELSLTLTACYETAT